MGFWAGVRFSHRALVWGWGFGLGVGFQKEVRVLDWGFWLRFRTRLVYGYNFISGHIFTFLHMYN